MRNSKMIFMFMVAMLLGVSASMFITSSLLAEEDTKKAGRGGIIGALEGIRKGMEEKDSAVMKDEAQPKPEIKKVEDEWHPDFIVEEGERGREVISTTDEQGNTTTVYRTKNGVWVKEVTDKNGNVILVERKVETPDGGKKVETIDHKAGTKTQATYDAEGRMTSSYTENINGTKTVAKYKGGVIMLSRTTDSLGNLTRTTYDHQGRVEHSQTKDKSGKVKETTDREDIEGTDTVKHVDNERGITTVTATAPDGSKIEETRDNKTGETLSEVGISADGNHFIYKTGSDADKAFEEGEHISTTKYSSTKDWVGDQESETEFRIHKDEAELDRQLKAQMAGEKAVSGDDIIVSSNFTERTRVSRQENQDGERATEIEHIATSSEVRAVNPDGQYIVKSAGKQVSAEGYGKTPSEALSNALDSAAGTVITHIKSEFLERTRHTQKTDGRVETYKSDEDITSTLDASSFAVFDGYEVESVKTDEGHFVVKVRATPGVTVRK